MNIEIKGVSKSFGKKTVLKNLSFSARGGQFIGILGENGSGKSTLFSVVTGLQKGEGEFLLDGVNLLRKPSLRAKKVGFVPQSPPLLGELTARDNLRLWYSKNDMLRSLERGFLKLLGIDEFIDLPVNKMSGGMKKTLAIGCAVAHKPEILLLDEPSAALDLVCKERIANYLKDFKKSGGTVLLATHDAQELELCDSLYILKDGSLKSFQYDGNIHHLVGQL